ncbi:MAG: EamA family transporter [Alphaproteobacteria bacterium]|nr:EamA family transporter [Alphaproteobacteria bacterium]
MVAFVFLPGPVTAARRWQRASPALFARRRQALRPYTAAQQGNRAVTATHLTPRDALLALAIVFVWGTNFVVIRLGLDALPPLFFATLRFGFVLVPAAFFLKRPAVSWRSLAVYGLATGLGQFGLLFIAIKSMISPGLASLVVQMQAFYTIAISLWRANGRGTAAAEKLSAHHFAAFTLALAGMGVIAANTGSHDGNGVTLPGLVLVLLAGLGWAISNQTAREAAQDARAAGQPLNMLAFVVWASLFSLPVLLALSLITEGPAAIAAGLHQASAVTWAAVLWQSVGNTMFGYTCWAILLSRYPAATIAPLSLLVPIFGFGASALILGEPLPVWKVAATVLIMGGLGVNILWRPRKAMLAGEPD